MVFGSRFRVLIILLLSLTACEQRLNKEPITIEATFMQYACGSWTDDMMINSIADTSYNFLVGKHIDPEILNGESRIRGWLYDNETKEYRYDYRLTGYICKCAKHGCGDEFPKFWISHIEKLDGSEFIMEGKSW